MYTDSIDKNFKVEFTCKALGEDKLSMQKFSGSIGENFIFFRKEFEDIKKRCNWESVSDGTPSQDLDQLRRALHGQALQEFISREEPYNTLKEAFDSLQ